MDSGYILHKYEGNETSFKMPRAVENEFVFLGFQHIHTQILIYIKKVMAKAKIISYFIHFILVLKLNKKTKTNCKKSLSL